MYFWVIIYMAQLIDFFYIDNNKIIESKDAIFHENIFPFKYKKSGRFEQ